MEMTAPHEIAVVPNATHLFEERGALAEVAVLACAWFGRHVPIVDR
jgi:putative phosphoribosyl transferase